MSMQQKIFDKVAVHLLRQNAKSRDEEGKCFYRGPNGLMCGIGILIPDDQYIAMEHEYCSASDLTLEGEVLESLAPHAEFMNALQYVHDGYTPNLWMDKLTAYAADKGLTMPNPEDFPNPLVPGIPE